MRSHSSAEEYSEDEADAVILVDSDILILVGGLAFGTAKEKMFRR